MRFSKYQYCFLFLALFCFNTVSFSQQDTVKANYYSRIALIFYEHNYYDSAIFYLSKAIEFDSNYYYYGSRGTIYAEMGDTSNALKDMNKAIELNNKDWQLYYERGKFEKANNEFEKAISDFTQANILDGKYYYVIFQRALCYLEINKCQKSLDDFNFLIKETPENIDYYCYRGLDNNCLSNYNEAISDFNKAFKSADLNKNDYLSCLYERGRSYFFSNKIDSAIVDWEEYVRAKDSAPAYTYLARAYFQNSDTIKAKLYIEKSIAIDPTYKEANYWKGLMCFFLGDCSSAISEFNMFEEYLDKYEISYTDFYARRASAYLCIGDTLKYISDYNIAINSDQSNIELYLNQLKDMQLSFNQYDIIKKDILKVISMDINSTDKSFLYSLLGFYTFLNNDTVNAEFFYKKAIDVTPDSLYPYYNLALFYTLSNLETHINQTIELLEKCLTINDGFFEVYKLLAICYGRQGNIEKACEITQEAVKNITANDELNDLYKAYCKGKKMNKELHLETFISNEKDLLKYFDRILHDMKN